MPEQLTLCHPRGAQIADVVIFTSAISIGDGSIAKITPRHSVVGILGDRRLTTIPNIPLTHRWCGGATRTASRTS